MNMNRDYQYFSFSILLLVIGIKIIYRAIIRKKDNTSSISNYSLKKNISNKINNYYRTLNELVGITGTEIILELLMRVGLVFSTILVISQILSITLPQIIFLTFLSSLILASWIQGIRTRYIKKYVESFELEFSDFVESLALAINSGLPLISGLNRVLAEHLKDESPSKSQFRISKMRKIPSFGLRSYHRKSNSPLKRELLFLQNRLEEGASASSAFNTMSLRLNSALMSNFSDAITLSLNRGTPLSNMLSDHADSIRESQKRTLLERAGRAEVKMMVPVVFLLLPISVLFALWPSFQQLQQLVIIP